MSREKEYIISKFEEIDAICEDLREYVKDKQDKCSCGWVPDTLDEIGRLVFGQEWKL